MRLTTYDLEMTNSRTPELVKESSCNYHEDILNSPEKIINMLNHVFHLDKKCEEHLMMVCFDTKYHPVGIFELSKGSANASVFGVREIMMRALLCGAVHISTVHNHPSGDPTPSKEDMGCCKRLKDACAIMGIELIDNIIIGNDCHYSFKESGLL